LGSAQVKAANKMLMKLTLAVKKISIKIIPVHIDILYSSAHKKYKPIFTKFW